MGSELELTNMEISRRLADLTGPDEDMDDIVFAIAWRLPWPLRGAAFTDQALLQRQGLSLFTRSTDAALHAIAQLLPGAIWKIGNDGGPNAEVRDPATGRSYTSVGSNPAMALLSAAFHVAAENVAGAPAMDVETPGRG